MEREGSSRRGVSCRKLEGEVRDGARAREDAEPDPLAAAELGDSLHDVGSAGNLEYVRTHDGLGLPGNYDGRLRLVLGAGWPAPGPADDLNGSSVTGVDVGLGPGLVGGRGGGRGAAGGGGGIVLRGLPVAGGEVEVVGEGVEVL